jgi:hypothetical protein
MSLQAKLVYRTNSTIIAKYIIRYEILGSHDSEKVDVGLLGNTAVKMGAGYFSKPEPTYKSTWHY